MKTRQMPSRRVRLALAAVAGGAAALATAAGASAHEHRSVAQGAYSMVVGWSGEPTFTGARNAVQLFVKDASGNPVTDLGSDSLKVQVVYQGQKSDPMPLVPAFSANFGTPGEYDAQLEPTRPGEYTFHFTGAIHGTAIDESFTSSEKTFDSVRDDTSIEFPVKDPSRAELSTAVQRVTGRVAPLPDRIAAVQSSAQTANDAGTRATVLSVVALVLALLVGVVLGMRLRRRTAPTAASARAVGAESRSRR